MSHTGAVPPWMARPIAFGGLVVFVAALGYGAVRFVTVFGVDTPGPVRPRAVVVNVALFSVFALHHSVFARPWVRDRVARAAGALERSAYVWLASGLFMAVCALWRPVAGVVWRADAGAAMWVLVALQVEGLVLSVGSAAIIDVGELSGVAQVTRPTPATPDPPGRFDTRGPYGWVRHPIYLGWLLMVFAAGTMTTTRLVFAVVSSVYLLVAIPFEERSLRRTSAGSYDRYMREVRWKLVPRIY